MFIKNVKDVLLSIFGELEMTDVTKGQQIDPDLRNIGTGRSKAGIVCCLFWRDQTLTVLQTHCSHATARDCSRVSIDYSTE